MGTAGVFLVAMGMCLLWLFSGPWFHFSDTWQLIINTPTTVLTFLGLFLVQNTQNRDSLAVQLKLDEIILKIQGPRDELAGVEKKSIKEIERLREQADPDLHHD